jgi:hypothetical protein
MPVAFGELTFTWKPRRSSRFAQFLRDDPRCRFVNFTDARRRLSRAREALRRRLPLLSPR